MRKIITIVALVAVALIGVNFGAVGRVVAHELRTSHGISGVLHVNPDDNPIAGQPTKLEESFGDRLGVFSLQDCSCQLSVTQHNKVLQTSKLVPASSSSTLAAVATVQFPSVGTYDVTVQGSAKDGKFDNFRLDYGVRVARSVHAATPSKNSRWLVLTGGAVVIASLGAFIVLRRRPNQPIP